MSGSDKDSVGVVCWSKHLLIERMVDLLPECELAEALRCHSVVEAVLVVTLEPVPDVLQVLFLTDADLAKVNDCLVPTRNRGIEGLSLFDTPI